MAWVAGCGLNVAAVAGNVLGMTSVRERFRRLHHSFWRRVQNGPDDVPLKRILSQKVLVRRECAFLPSLAATADWKEFLTFWGGHGLQQKAFASWQSETRRAVVASEALRCNRTKIIPMDCRVTRNCSMSDITLSAPRDCQDRLFHYRIGQFCLKRKCPCGRDFRRGHERCIALGVQSPLSEKEKAERFAMGVVLTNGMCLFTDVDWLLNTGRLDRANQFLVEIEQKLKATFRVQAEKLSAD